MSIRPTKKEDKFSQIVVSLLSPKSILRQSCGEVKEYETRNHRTFKPEPDGLFCERIFGPEQDYQCSCGKFQSAKYETITCDKCGVKVTSSKVRRERVGHIKLSVPVVHPWYYQYHPNKIATLLGVPANKLENIIYHTLYVVIQPGPLAKGGISKMSLFTIAEYDKVMENLPASNNALSDDDPQKFIAKTGAEAIQALLQEFDPPALLSLAKELKEEMLYATSQQRRAEAGKRLSVVNAFLRAPESGVENRPEWMVINYIQVPPPAIRPVNRLDNNRIVTSDMSLLLQQILISNNRHARLKQINAPDIVRRHEERIIQEKYNAYVDSAAKPSGSSRPESGRVYKSVSEQLRGKTGLLRQDLLGKRVDFSGRSVIVVGPELKIYQCGLPKEMALELFKPFVVRRLLDRGVALNYREAKKVIASKEPIVWEILKTHLDTGHPVLLNRAPTLHRLSIQAFFPLLVEGKSIQLHPLTCAAFNADFDGDTMAVHVPLSQEAIMESFLIMLAPINILNPANGNPIAVPSKDMVSGLYYLTKGKKSTEKFAVKGEGMVFSSPEELLIALNDRKVSKHAHVRLKARVADEKGHLQEQFIDTVAGRALFNQYVPEELGFINELLTAKRIGGIVKEACQKLGTIRTAKFIDSLKDLGFQAVYEGGLTYGLDDIKIPPAKEEILRQAREKVEHVLASYQEGIITNNEKSSQIIDIWTKASSKITNELVSALEEDERQKERFNTISIMLDSGARGSVEQYRQTGGMRGMVSKPQSKSSNAGVAVESPITANLLEGVDTLEYYVSTHGARKGLSDTALRTADAGYLTRKLVDVAQGVVITEKDCGTFNGRKVYPVDESGQLKVSLSHQIVGRVSLRDIFHPDPSQKRLIVQAGQEITEALAHELETLNVLHVEVRSPLHCEARDGVCVKCYGRNLARNHMVHVGEPVGVVAAQSIAEPGTQLTLRTFHSGGIVSSTIIEDTVLASQEGIVRLANFHSVPMVNRDGNKVEVVTNKRSELQLLDPNTYYEIANYVLPYGAHLMVKEGDKVEKEQPLYEWDPYNALIISSVSGVVHFESLEAGVTYKEEYDEQTGYREKVIIQAKDKSKVPNLVITDPNGKKVSYTVPVKAYLTVEEGDRVVAGEVLAKSPRPTASAKDITGGLPRVTELFEAREPSNAAVLTSIDGVVSYGAQKRTTQEVIVTAKDGTEKRYKVPLTRQIMVQEGDYVKANTPLSDGPVSLEKLLEIKGLNALYDYLINEIQAVYRLQGVKIDDKHIEVILRQMVQKVEVTHPNDTYLVVGEVIALEELQAKNEALLKCKVVTDPGDSTTYAAGDPISAYELEIEQTRLQAQGKAAIQVRAPRLAVAKRKLQGITRATITGGSFLAAASFQETVKVFSKAAISAAVDDLKGLKENVIVGALIPAGTGREAYRRIRVSSKKELEKLQKLPLTAGRTDAGTFAAPY